MNTEIVFYCTHAEYGEFKKTIFSTIHPKEFTSLSEVNDWLDNNISFFCNEFYLDLVFEWVIVHYKQTEDKVKYTDIVESFSGRLVFDDDLNYQLMKIKSQNYDILKETEKLKKELKELKEEKPKPKKKDYPSVWIDPSGQSYVVGFACHNDFAMHYLDSIQEKDTYYLSNKYAYKILQERGWIRILGWYDPPQFVIIKVTPKQKVTLREYCIKNEVKYQDYPDILKS